MTLSPGIRIGAYEIAALIGSGGMGEVYRARDTKLNREVAVKVLPEAFALDPDRLARFNREAHVLASLNHPNIAGIYGFEENADAPALVLELVEGPTLGDRIAQGAIPVDEALPIARQIAEALEAAHEQGIIHRDLKPANIKLRRDGTVKVLDFGLAKAFEGPGGAGGAGGDGVTAFPTITSPAMTRTGIILGTAAYMSPEQARGQQVDKRTDIWAFACVLYEILSGRRAFPGAKDGTVTDTIAAVLKDQPEWNALPGATPPAIRKLLRRCFEKEPKSRLHDIADARLELEEAAHDMIAAADPGTHSPVYSTHSTHPTYQTWVAFILCCVASIGIGWLLGTRSRPSAAAVVSRWLLDVRPATTLLGWSPLERTEFGRSRPSRTALALSPDGRTLAFTAQRDGTTQLYIRPLDQAAAAPVGGTEGADGPFFSPDGDWVAFWSAGAIRRVALAGGPPVKVCDAELPFGTTWPSDDTIIFANANTTIWKVASAGGVPQELTKRPADGREARHFLPRVLPGGKWLLFTVQPTVHDWEHSRVVAQSLATGEQKTIVEDAADARYLPTGHLVFMRLGNLMAVRFDAEDARLLGSATGMIEGILQSVNSTAVGLDTGAGQYAFSSTGTLVYVSGQVHPDIDGRIQWISRDGAIEEIPAPPRPYGLPKLSPDGRHIAVITAGMRDHSLWRYDLADGTLARLTTEGRVNWPFWSPDGTHIMLGLAVTGPYNLFSVRADGGTAPQRLGHSNVTQFAGGWTPDGHSFAFAEDPMNRDIKLLSIGPTPTVQPLLATRFNESMPEISPDGRWLAYVSDESGRQEVYVQAFPGLGGKRQISRAGGTNPAWSRNGRKLVYLAPPERPRAGYMQMMEVDVTLGATFSATSPRPLFQPSFGADVVRSYDLTPDAGRFIYVHETFSPSTSAPREIHVVENWFEEVKRLVPAK